MSNQTCEVISGDQNLCSLQVHHAKQGVIQGHEPTLPCSCCDQKLHLRMNVHVFAVRYACGVQDSCTKCSSDWCKVSMYEDSMLRCLSVYLMCTLIFMGMQLRFVAMLLRPNSESLDHHDLTVMEGFTMWP